MFLDVALQLYDAAGNVTGRRCLRMHKPFPINMLLLTRSRLRAIVESTLLSLLSHFSVPVCDAATCG